MISCCLIGVAIEGLVFQNTWNNRKPLFVFSSAAVCCALHFRICFPLQQSRLGLPHHSPAHLPYLLFMRTLAISFYVLCGYMHNRVYIDNPGSSIRSCSFTNTNPSIASTRHFLFSVHASFSL